MRTPFDFRPYPVGYGGGRFDTSGRNGKSQEVPIKRRLLAIQCDGKLFAATSRKSKFTWYKALRRPLWLVAGPEPKTMEEFHRIRRLPPYVFEQVNRAKAIARNAGADIIDLGMGNPDLPAPAHVIEKLKDTLGKPRTDRYSASKGIPGLRRAQAAYYERRFGVKLNHETQVVATLGSKEGFANVA